MLGFQRAFVIDPLIATSSIKSSSDRLSGDRSAFTIVGLGASLGTAIFVVIGSQLSAELARSLLLFGPWLIPLLVNDFLRSVLFRDGKAHIATILDSIWLGTLLACLPLVYYADADWVLVGAWGAGAVAAASIGLAVLRIRPWDLASSFQWWRSTALSLGRWLAATAVVYNACIYATTLLLALVLGPAALGGLRAVLSAMTPLSLLVPALSLPGLPAVTRASASSRSGARKLAVRIGASASLLATGYVLLMSLMPGLLGVVFGDEFDQYAELILPLGIGQIVAAFALGFILLLIAERKGLVFFVSRSVASMTSFILPVTLAMMAGVAGAAWALAIASFIGSSLTVLLATWKRRTLEIGVAVPAVRPRV
jgi:O-antigen/teichoic acid export membrane protein